MPFVDEVRGDSGDQADHGQQDAPPAGGAVSVDSLPEYLLAYLSPAVVFVGEVRPVRWQIARADGLACDVPGSASVALLDLQGNVVSGIATAVIDSSPPLLCQIVEALWTVLAAGTYRLRLTVEETGGETRVDEQTVVASP